jgi:uncharacterized protein YbaP (TraB family)
VRGAALLTFSVALALMMLPARAQPEPGKSPEEWAEIESVTVRAQPGPAVWRLTRGASEVWILGTVGFLPREMAWNRDSVADVLDGARAVLLPPRADFNLVDIAWFMIRHGSELSLPRGQVLEDSLPPDLRARFEATRAAIGADAGDYRTDIPIRAAVRLGQDFLKKADLGFREPRATVERLASRRRLSTAPVLRFDVMDAVRDLLKLTPEQQRTCLSQAVEDVTWGRIHAERAARAWAVGDIRTVKDHYSESRLFGCVIAQVERIGNIDARNTAETVSALDAALNQPGKTVALVAMGPLLRRDGVLARLKAKGVVIEAPVE